MITEIFGSMVFGEKEMKARLPHDTYKVFKKTVAAGGALPSGVADVVAEAVIRAARETGAARE